MGWTGALAGLGKGMQDYSTILGEQKKQDWLMQRDMVLHERNKELESLRNKNNMSVATQQHDWNVTDKETDFNRNQAALIGQEERNKSNWEEQHGVLKQDAIDLEGRKNTYAMGQIGATANAQADAQIKVAKEKSRLEIGQLYIASDVAIELDNDKRTAVYDRLIKSIGKEPTEDEKTEARMAAFAPELLVNIRAQSKENSQMAIEFQKETAGVYKEAWKDFGMLSEDKQKEWHKAARAKGEKDGQTAFALFQAAQFQSNFNPNQTNKQQAKEQPTQLVYKENVAQKISKDLTLNPKLLSEFESKFSGTVYQPIVDKFKKSGGMARGNAYLQSDPTVGTKSFVGGIAGKVLDFGGRNYKPESQLEKEWNQ